MQQRVNLVPLKEAWLPVVAEIAALSFPDPWSENLFRQTMDCCYNRMDDIAVHPNYRHRGIGRMLLQWAHQQFPEQEFWLEVRESNAIAIALYQSEGYQQVGFRKRYYHNPEEGAVLMTREANDLC